MNFLAVLIATLVVLAGLQQDGEAVPAIHVITHSHCDAGYWESFLEYWTSSVHAIIDSVLESRSHAEVRLGGGVLPLHLVEASQQ